MRKNSFIIDNLLFHDKELQFKSENIYCAWPGTILSIRRQRLKLQLCLQGGYILIGYTGKHIGKRSFDLYFVGDGDMVREGH